MTDVKAETVRTDELIKILSQNESNPLKALKEVTPYMDLPPLADHLKVLFEARGFAEAEVFEWIALERTMGYRIMSGTRNPSRNVLLRIAFVLSLSLEETQYLLNVGGKAALYPRVRRDALLVYGIAHQLTMPRMDEILLEADERSLYVRA